MKIRSRFLFSLFASAAALAFLGAPPVLRAQATTTTDRSAEYAHTMGQAVTLFASGKDAAAESSLGSFNRRKPGTAIWHAETAQRLFAVALRLSSAGAPKTATRVARRALHQIDLTVQKAGPADTDHLAANALDLAGLIAEQFLGDPSAAKRYYQQVLTLLPTDPTAKAALARLERNPALLNTK